MLQILYYVMRDGVPYAIVCYRLKTVLYNFLRAQCVYTYVCVCMCVYVRLTHYFAHFSNQNSSKQSAQLVEDVYNKYTNTKIAINIEHSKKLDNTNSPWVNF